MNKLGGRDQEAELNCVQFLGPKQGMDGLLSWEREEHGRPQNCSVAPEQDNGLVSAAV